MISNSLEINLINVSISLSNGMEWNGMNYFYCQLYLNLIDDAEGVFAAVDGREHVEAILKT